MKHKMTVKQCNPFVALALKKAGSHRKSNKSLCRAQKQNPLGGETLR